MTDAFDHEHAPSAPEDLARVDDALEAVAHDYMKALRAGTADRDAIMEGLPSIPAGELAARLRLCELMHEAAVESSRGGSDALSRARLRCPHCGEPQPLANLGPASCEECGSSFEVISDPLSPGSELAVPDEIGRFRIDCVLGRGAFGVVYRATDAELDRAVALKVPRAGAFTSAEDEERFLREARSSAALSHEGIVRVHEIIEYRGLPCIVCEYVDGFTLRQAIEDQVPGFRGSAQLVAAVADALEYAHQQGVVHRDVKPENILLDRDGNPHVTDFGLARRGETDVTVTLDGQIVGTPAYMSPEQAAGRHDDVDARSDVYSLGVVLYELLTRERPFSGQRSMVLHQVIHDEPRQPRRLNEHIPRDLETIALTAMEKEPGRRYANCGDLAADLRRYLAGEMIVMRPVGRAERAWRWCRRNPGLSGTLALSTVLLLAGFSSFLVWQQKKQGELEIEIVAKDQAIEEKDQAIEAKDRAIDAKGTAISAKDAALQRAEGLRLLAHSTAVLRDDPTLALLLAIEGAEREPGLVANNALLAALGKLRERRTLPIRSTCGRATISRDGRRIVTVHLDDTARIWDARTFEPVCVLVGHTEQLTSADFSVDGTKVVTSSFDGTTRVWDIATAKEEILLEGESRVHCADLSPDGKRVATASETGARLWDLESRRSRVLGRGCAYRVAFDSDGSRVLTAHEDGTARIWRSKDGVRLFELGGHRNAVQSAAFSADGEHAITADWTDRVRLWDSRQGKLLRVATIEHRVVTAAEFSPDGRRFIAACEDGGTRICDASTGRVLVVLGRQRSRARSATFSSDGMTALTFADDWTSCVWDIDEPLDTEALADPPRWHPQTPFSPDGRSVVSIENGHKASVRDLATGREVAVLEGHTRPITCCSFSLDGRRIVSASVDGTTRVWDANRGEPIAVLRGHGARVESAEVSPDGTRVVTASRDHTAKIWDAESGECLRTLEGHARVVNHASFSRDGALVATASLDRTARVWNAATAELRMTLDHDSGYVRCVNFSADGRRLITSTHDNLARVWDVSTGDVLAVLKGHDGDVPYAALRADGKLAVTCSKDQTARIWDVASGRPIATVRTRFRRFGFATFSASGNRVFTVEGHAVCRAWPIDPLPVALSRKPRELTRHELDQYQIGSPEERLERRRDLSVENARAEFEFARRTLALDRANPRLRRHYREALAKLGPRWAGRIWRRVRTWARQRLLGLDEPDGD